MRNGETDLPNPAFINVTASVARVTGDWVVEDGFTGVVDFGVAITKKYMLQVAGKATVRKLVGTGKSFAKGDLVVAASGATPNVLSADVYSSGQYHGIALKAAGESDTTVEVLLVFPSLPGAEGA
jgi:hypothetical protein